MTRSTCWIFVSCWAILAVLMQAAEELYYGCEVEFLTLGKSTTHQADVKMDGLWSSRSWKGWRVILDGPGQAFLNTDGPYERDSILFARVKRGQAIKGRFICIPEADNSSATIVPFEMPAKYTVQVTSNGFQKGREQFYAKLWLDGLPGSAWFRHQLDDAQKQLRAGGRQPAMVGENMRRGMFRPESDQMFDMLSGGRAISENLQLRRAMLSPASEDNQLIALDTVAGITTKEVDWSKLNKGLDPKIDSLAALIPADQHAVFFPSFTDLLRIADEAEAGVTPILHTIEPRAEDVETIERYQTQLCLSRSGLSRILGPKYIRSVALTGSDLNYRTGTDVAVLFEAVNAAELQTLLETKIILTLFGRPGVQELQGKINGVSYTGHRTADRTISTYLAIVDNAVVVTNSLPQLRRLIETQAHRENSLAALPEMKYFRERYKLGDANEHAFVILSDATIRRWCGPRWRIGSARQLRELATMMELTSARLDELVQRKPAAKPLDPNVFQTKVHDYRLLPDGIISPTVGSLRFLTPIAELPLPSATRKEVADYSAWRDNYQRNWTRGFDPIAIRLTLFPDRIATDVSVLPLIENTKYREMIALTTGSTLSAGAGDPHSEALLHFVMSIGHPQNKNSLSSLSAIAVQTIVDEEYLGGSLTVYLDDDPLWEELAKLSPRDLQNKIGTNCPNLPLAIRIQIGSSDQAIAGSIDQIGKFERIAKDFFGYNKRTIETYRGIRYVCASTEQKHGFFFPLSPTFFLTVCGDAMTIAFHEQTLKKAIDRSLDVQLADEPPKENDESLSANLGEQAVLHLDARAIELFELLSTRPRQSEIQNLAWSNISILNEWKRLYPDQDPVELHARLWKTRLVCPGGGKYVWNDEWHTMESTLYGHPAQPKEGPLPSLSSLGIRAADFGLTFVDGGLRARVEITRQPAKPFVNILAPGQ